MSFADHLIHTCTIERATTTRDAYNHDVEAWAPQLSGLRCRLVIGTQRVAFSELAEKPVITTYKVLVPAGTAVDEGDRVVNVIVEDGTIEAGPFRIDSVLPRRGAGLHHITLLLERTT